MSKSLPGSAAPSLTRGADSQRSSYPALTIGWLFAIATATTLAFLAQGSRGIWEPDEGFYSNVAYHMVESGDWWIPQLNGEPFLDKPPLHYWGMALGMKVFGVNGWALRVVNALWFLGTALLVGCLAARFWGRNSGPIACLVYSTMLAPFVAGNILTPDTALTFCVTATYFTYWQRRQVRNRSRAQWIWAALLGLCGGFGVLAKGPAFAVFATPLVVDQMLRHRWAALRRFDSWLAGGIATLVGASWYASVFYSVPGAMQYVFDNQVAGRLWSDHYMRNPGWLGPIKVYGPMVVAGSLPWLPAILKEVRRGWLGFRRRGFVWFSDHPAETLLSLWVMLPMTVLFLANSRLPLYALPVMPALALVAARAASKYDWMQRISQ